MGGPGSSRWGKHRAKPSADGRKSLNVERWDELELLKPGSSFMWKWNAREPFKASIVVTVAEDGRSVTLAYTPELTPKGRRGRAPRGARPQNKPACDIGRNSTPIGDQSTTCLADKSQNEAQPGGQVFLSPNDDQAGEDGVGITDSISFVVGIDWDNCHLGGRRPFFVCPGEGCGLRVVRLYARETLFYCRNCTGLAYSTQRMTPEQRALVKARRIKKKVGLPYADQKAIAIPLRPVGMHQLTYDELRQVLEELYRVALSIDPRDNTNNQPSVENGSSAA